MPALCNDTTDNDGDGKMDFPADPGCASASDDSEQDDCSPTVGPNCPVCSNGMDDDLDTQADYDALFDDYEREWLPKQGAALKKIQRWIGAGQRVALTCYEHLPNQCHRHCVAEALEKKVGKGISAKHL